jgi:hypothetical protein
VRPCARHLVDTAAPSRRGARAQLRRPAPRRSLLEAASTSTKGGPALELVRGGAARRAARLGWVTAAPVRAARRGAASGAWGTPSRRPDRADRTPRRRVRPSQVSGAAHEARCAPPAARAGALAAVTSRHQLGAVRCSPPHSRDATAALGNRRDPSAVREVRRPRKSCAWCARLDTRARAGGVAFLTDARAAALWRPQRSREERCLSKMPTRPRPRSPRRPCLCLRVRRGHTLAGLVHASARRAGRSRTSQTAPRPQLQPRAVLAWRK